MTFRPRGAPLLSMSFTGFQMSRSASSAAFAMVAEHAMKTGCEP
jgi:hypothetical protein